MIGGLTQGLLGRARLALTPSSVALGPNTYLAEKDFLKMLGIAFLVHLFAFGIYALVPNQKVTDIPVRALSFKLGSEDKIGAYAPVPIMATPPDAPIPPPVLQATTGTSWRASPTMPAPVVPTPLKALPKIAPPKPVVKQPKVVKVTDPVPAPITPPAPLLAPLPVAVAPQPQQYVREVGAPSPQAVQAAVNAASPLGTSGAQGMTSATTEQTAQAIRAKYETEISGWIQRHKDYPPAAGGREGRAVVRMRIDRAGNVRYYAIEQSAGMTALDEAALDMIRRANPVPAVPDNYPAGNLVEFLIPITFKAPQ